MEQLIPVRTGERRVSYPERYKIEAEGTRPNQQDKTGSTSRQDIHKNRCSQHGFRTQLGTLRTQDRLGLISWSSCFMADRSLVYCWSVSGLDHVAAQELYDLHERWDLCHADPAQPIMTIDREYFNRWSRSWSARCVATFTHGLSPPFDIVFDSGVHTVIIDSQGQR